MGGKLEFYTNSDGAMGSYAKIYYFITTVEGTTITTTLRASSGDIGQNGTTLYCADETQTEFMQLNLTIKGGYCSSTAFMI